MFDLHDVISVHATTSPVNVISGQFTRLPGDERPMSGI
jgi:hypothetical protein